jgi:hypothetical protein
MENISSMADNMHICVVGCAPSAVRTGNKSIKKASVAKSQKQEVPIDDKIAEFEKILILKKLKATRKTGYYQHWKSSLPQ